MVKASKKVEDKILETPLGKKRESEIIAELNPQKEKTVFSVKDGGKDTYIVVGQKGEVIRTYKKDEVCEDPKKAAEEYAKKLSK